MTTSHAGGPRHTPPALDLAPLRDVTVRSWHGVEMAVRGDDEHPDFGGPDMPCLQLTVLTARLADGTAVAVDTWQHDTGFALCAAPAPPPGAPSTGYYRSRDLPELPTGRVTAMAETTESGMVFEARLHIGGRDLLLIAGEAHEDWSGDLYWCRHDESVLAFTDPSAADRLTWRPPRP